MSLTKIISCFFIVFLLSACAKKQLAYLKAYDLIAHMKDSFILVRLNSGTNKINYLKKINDSDRLALEIEKIENQNEEIIHAFDSVFNFCRVYFFYSDDGSALKNKQYDQVELFDKKGNTVSSEILETDPLVIAAYGRSYVNQFVTDNERGRYSSGGSNGREAIVLYDSDYIQLPSEFPYRVPVESNVKRPLLRAIKQLDLNLIEYELYARYDRAAVEAKIMKRKLRRNKE